jgi:hypothetical protein
VAFDFELALSLDFFFKRPVRPACNPEMQGPLYHFVAEGLFVSRMALCQDVAVSLSLCVCVLAFLDVHKGRVLVSVFLFV